MGILNVTPDSFSDGGKFFSVNNALKQAHKMAADGALFIDVGGESTRPRAAQISADEELTRVIPVIEAITKELDVVVSIDTSKPQVMRAAVAAGASLINDVRALHLPDALETAAQLARDHNIPVCIMHMQGTPITMQNSPIYLSVVDEVLAFFNQQIAILTQAGFLHSQIIIDPGFGFGKSLDHNYQLLKHLGQFTQFGLPLLAGMSRKSMIGNLINKDVDNRVYGDVAAVTLAAMSGANIMRVHDVAQTLDAIKIVDKINSVN